MRSYFISSRILLEIISQSDLKIILANETDNTARPTPSPYHSPSIPKSK